MVSVLVLHNVKPSEKERYMKVKKAMLVPEYYREHIQPRLPWLLNNADGRPFLFYSKRGILQSGYSLKQAFHRVNYQNCSCVKALPNPWITEFLHKGLGFGTDCSSTSELLLSRAVGVPGTDTMYSSNRTTRDQYEVAMRDGGCIINFDDITAMDRVPGKFPEVVCFRINPGKRRTGNAIIGNPYDAKYGITYNQIIPAYHGAMKRGAGVFGIHMMVCSNEKRSPYFVETIREILLVAAMLKRKLGIEVSIVDIGGGFGIPYKAGDRILNLEWIGERGSKLLNDFGNEYGFMPKLITECGRFVTGPHGFLVNPVVSVEQKYRHFVGVEAGMLGCPRPAFYGSYHYTEVYSPSGELRTGPCHFTNIADSLCENWGRLTPVDRPRWLPKSIRPGDIMVTFNCGAHSGAMASNYNGWPRLAEYLDQDGTNENVIKIRRAERDEDLFRTVTRSGRFTLPGQGV